MADRYRVVLPESGDRMSVEGQIAPGVTASGRDCIRAGESYGSYRPAEIVHSGASDELEPEAYQEALLEAGWQLVSDWTPCLDGGHEAWVEPVALEQGPIDWEQDYDPAAPTFDTPLAGREPWPTGHQGASGQEDRLAAAVAMAQHRQAQRQQSRELRDRESSQER